MTREKRKTKKKKTVSLFIKKNLAKFHQMKIMSREKGPLEMAKIWLFSGTFLQLLKTL